MLTQDYVLGLALGDGTQWSHDKLGRVPQWGTDVN